MTKRIMKYNPAFLSDEELIESFVVRRIDMELIVDIIRNNTNLSNQHVLVIGPRGIGKTTLVLRVAAEVRRDAELSQRWYPLVFGEESYQVCSPGEFWLEALFHLARQTKQDRWSRTYEELKKINEEDRLRESALAQLMDFADEQNKRILLIVENLQQLLGDQIADDQAWKLRHTLQHEPRVMLLATATTRFDEMENHGKAMFELFKSHDLKPLSTEDCQTIWKANTGNDFTYNQIRPIQILTGGNPRLITIIAQFAKDISLQHLMEDLIQLVDDHTEYFKTHLDNLAVIERKVYLALAEIWKPATAKEVAAAARLDVNKTSSLLNRLITRGAVIVTDDRKRTKTYYVAERLYNIYYLMRRRGEPSSRVKAIIRFLVPFYGPKKTLEIITKEACCLSPAFRQDYYVLYQSLLEESDSSMRKELFKSTPVQFFDIKYTPRKLKEIVVSQLCSEIDELRSKSRELYEKDDFEGAEKLERRIIDLNPMDISAWYNIGLTKVYQNKYIEAEESFRKVIEIQPDDTDAWYNLGYVLNEQERFKDAENAFYKAIEIQPNNANTRTILGVFLGKQERYKEAEETFLKAIVIQPDNANAWYNLGFLLDKQGRNIESEEAYRKAIDIQPSYMDAWTNLGNVLNKQERYKEAEETLLKAIEIQPDNANAWYNLGFLLNKQGRDIESEEAYRKAIEIQPRYMNAWNNLGNVLNKQERYKEAEETFLKAIEIHPSNANLWNNLGHVLDEQKRYKEAEEVYIKAIEIKPEDAHVWNTLGVLLGKQERYKEAEKHSRKSLEISPNNSEYQHTLASILLEMGNSDEALELTTSFVKDSEFINNYKTDVNTLIIAFAAKGYASQVLEILQNSPSAEILEPLIVGLRLYLGEDERDIRTPLEVLEIGKDVVKRIEERKAEMEGEADVSSTDA